MRQSIFPLLLLAGSLGFSSYLLLKPAEIEASIPEAEKTREVLAVQLKAQHHYASWKTGGLLTPAKRIILSNQVAGILEGLSDSVYPGAKISKGQLLANIDPSELQLKLQQAQSNVASAKAELDIEVGQQKLAAAQYQLAKHILKGKSEALALRQPQLEIAKAKLALSETALAEAKLQLSYTRIHAPTDAVVLRKQVDQGSYLSANTPLMELAANDEYWLNVKVPASFLSWVNDDTEVLYSHPSWGEKQYPGKILSVQSEVNNADRQAQILVAVTLTNHEQHKPLLNQYLDVTLRTPIPGETIQLSREWLNDQQKLWLIKDERLEKHTANPIFTGRDTIIVNSNTLAQQWVAAQKLIAVNDGMPVRKVLLKDKATKEVSPEQRSMQLESPNADQAQENRS
ncbi:efflux RND transporter periplasmic adaptor subunit [Pseudoteredinibacter isoporae]|uniref:RND family efflux transporter MFP subunit n=1 Tax=Pseudoteredinibacter isoporae TaxID=570281 RepID=A0A7X0JPT3_9GAMM|nr:efflux RND transporter periplasmic adaptor subunit [Pseudoteredinibacter isoporae]MBB6520078.1 RND family efflux transporter MFP subunit [Pseudoteredinibacter isoporae]NHO85650.1 efflux RND transporter periplasmic adaptor subunit [Pseudoteredinibacter isoporae]NIB25898.1 efflux RND transporter periplasmic adaptor subunit [Pseudoteredinibacter isoporae]